MMMRLTSVFFSPPWYELNLCCVAVVTSICSVAMVKFICSVAMVKSPCSVDMIKCFHVLCSFLCSVAMVKCRWKALLPWWNVMLCCYGKIITCSVAMVKFWWKAMLPWSNVYGVYRGKMLTCPVAMVKIILTSRSVAMVKICPVAMVKNGWIAVAKCWRMRCCHGNVDHSALCCCAVDVGCRVLTHVCAVNIDLCCCLENCFLFQCWTPLHMLSSCVDCWAVMTCSLVSL